MRKGNYNIKNSSSYSRAGFTLVEVLIVIVIASLIVLVTLSLNTNISTLQNLVGQKLQSRADIDQTMQIITTEMRSASPSASGGYPIVSAATSSFTFYSDINRNGTVEQIRYFTSSTSLWKGVIQPTGTPAVYTTSTEIKTDVVDNLVFATSSPLFQYYNSTYTVSSTALSYPIDISQIRVVQVSFTTDVNAKVAPGGEYFSTIIAIRNLLNN